MSHPFTPVTCPNCGRAFDLANPWTQLDPDANLAQCVHCGKWDDADPEDLAKARAVRAACKPLPPGAVL